MKVSVFLVVSNDETQVHGRRVGLLGRDINLM
jgi:hypothetical protein